ncbi:MAG TPA: hypothetical protein VJ783_18325 [Pirellulales bacterium]|nr:hypothetical protein [Pirellulales bacterium]
MPKTRFSESFWTQAAGRSAGEWQAVVVSFCAAIAALTIVSLALSPGTPQETAPPVAVVRLLDGGGDLEIAAARLLTIEQLSRALRESRFPAARGIADVALAEAAEKVRPSLRVDIDPGGRGDTPAVTIRWIGDTSTPGVLTLVNWLAQHFNDAPQAERIVAAEQSHQAAAAKLHEANDAVAIAEESFQRAIAEAELPEIEDLHSARRTTDVHAMEPAGGSSSAAGRSSPLQAQLDELESQRGSLAERLMPAHPEMRALDEQIAAVRAKLAEAPAIDSPPAVAVPVPPRASPYGPASNLPAIGRQWEAVHVARRRQEAAAGEERLAWQRLTQSRAGRSVEILPATSAGPSGPTVAWWRAAAAGLAGWLAGWLVLVFWPSPTAPLTTIEQIRRTTRLPVIAVPSLN